MPVSYDDIKIESAQEYFLVPIKDQESFYYLGNKNKLNALKIVMEASKVIATGGVANKDEEDTDETGTRCYILIDADRDECQDILKQVDEVMIKGIKNVE